MTLIVSTHSYRGGTGKSNITANLAATIGARGLKVAIVDTDIQSPGIHALFGVDPKALHYTLNDYLWGRCSVEQAAVDVTEAAGVSGGGQVLLVPSSIRTGEIARILKEGYDVNALNDGFRELCQALALDVLLIDTHPGVNEETLLSIAISDTLLLVVRPDIQDYQGTAVTLDLARHLNVPQLLIVMNKVISSFDYQKLRESVMSTYKTPIATILPLSEDLVRLGSNGLITVQEPQHEFTDGIKQIVDLIIEQS